jgi:hypothetical protein
LWYSLAGISKIEVPRSIDAVKNYVSKYVVKGGEVDFSSNLHLTDLLLLPSPDARAGRGDQASGGVFPVIRLPEPQPSLLGGPLPAGEDSERSNGSGVPAREGAASLGHPSGCTFVNGDLFDSPMTLPAVN